MTQQEAIDKLRHIFHKTRLTQNVSVPSEIISAILYPQELQGLTGWDLVKGLENGSIALDREMRPYHKSRV